MSRCIQIFVYICVNLCWMIFKSSLLRFQTLWQHLFYISVIQFDQHFKQESVLRGVDTRLLFSEVCHAFLSTFFKYKCLSHLSSVQCYHWASAQISFQCTQHTTSWFQRLRCITMSQIRKLKCPPSCAQLTFLAHTKSGVSSSQGLTALVVSAEAFVLPVLSCRVFL